MSLCEHQFVGESLTAFAAWTLLEGLSRASSGQRGFEGAWSQSSSNFRSLSERQFVGRDTTESVAMSRVLPGVPWRFFGRTCELDDAAVATPMQHLRQCDSCRSLNYRYTSQALNTGRSCVLQRTTVR